MPPPLEEETLRVTLALPLTAQEAATVDARLTTAVASLPGAERLEYQAPPGSLTRKLSEYLEEHPLD